MKSFFVRAIVIIAVITGIFALVFYQTGKTPVEKWNEASENLTKAKDVSLKGKGESKIEGKDLPMGTSISLDMEMDIEETYIKGPAKGFKDDQFFYHLVTRYTGAETMIDDADKSDYDTDQKVYLKDGKVYINDVGNHFPVKMEMNDDGLLKAMETLSEKLEMMKIDEYVISSSANGNSITLALDGQKLALYVIELIIDEAEDMGPKEKKEALDVASEMLKIAGIDTVNVSAVVEDDNFRSINTSVKANVDVQALMKTFYDAFEDEGESEGMSDFGFETGPLLRMAGSDKDVFSLGADSGGKISVDTEISLEDIKINKGVKIKYPDLTKFESWD